MFYATQILENLLYYIHIDIYFDLVCNYLQQYKWHNNILIIQSCIKFGLEEKNCKIYYIGCSNYYSFYQRKFSFHKGTYIRYSDKLLHLHTCGHHLIFNWDNICSNYYTGENGSFLNIFPINAKAIVVCGINKSVAIFNRAYVDNSEKIVDPSKYCHIFSSSNLHLTIYKNVSDDSLVKKVYDHINKYDMHEIISDIEITKYDKYEEIRIVLNDNTPTDQRFSLVTIPMTRHKHYSL
jgi:hypothetical protein